MSERSRQSFVSAERRRAQLGMTLLELMITLAVIALLMVVGYSAVRRVRDSELAENTVEIVQFMRTAYLVAAETGKQTRVVFDIDQQRYSIEVCPEARALTRGTSEQDVERLPLGIDPQALGAAAPPPPAAPQEQLSLDPSIPPELLHAESAEETVKMAAALSGKAVGALRCEVYVGTLGGKRDEAAVRQMRTDDTVKLRQIYVQHLEEPTTGGLVAINFFPLGYAEKAIIELGTDNGAYFSVISRGLGGRVELREGRVKDVDAIMLRDAAGSEEEQER